MSSFYCTAGRGTEIFIKKELSSTLEVDSISCIDGKVFFSTSETSRALLALKSVERLFVCVHRDEKFSIFGKQGLSKIRSLILNISEQLEKAYALLQDILKSEDEEATPNKRQKLEPEDTKDEAKVQFRVSCKVAGRQKYLTQDISKTVGVAVSSVLPWKVNLRSPVIEINVQLNNSGLTIGLPATKEPLSCRSYITHSGLRSTVSWIMAHLAEIQPFNIVLDPMCGTGALLMEAAKSWPAVQYIAADIDEKQLSKTRQNVKSGAVSNIQILHADATNLPLHEDSVDRIICDLPFGIQHLTKQQAQELYPKIMTEMARVLRSGGKAVVLTSHDLVKHLLHFCVPEEAVVNKTQGAEEDKMTKEEVIQPLDKHTPESSTENMPKDEHSKPIELRNSDNHEQLDNEKETSQNMHKRMWTLSEKHYLKLGDTHSYVCVVNKV